MRNDLFVDLKARITDLDLSPASPYSGKYAGYAIEKGKLSLDVKYSINGRKLDSQNDILIDQFNFGRRVESPEATSLPVRLAVALLKDRNGVIKLDLPVTGSLDNPKFSVWGVIKKIIVNLITKAATSPFSLLEAAFGGGGEGEVAALVIRFTMIFFMTPHTRIWGCRDFPSREESGLITLLSLKACATGGDPVGLSAPHEVELVDEDVVLRIEFAPV